MVPYDFDLSALVGGLHSGPFWEPKRTDDRLWFQLLAKKDPHYWSSRGRSGGDRRQGLLAGAQGARRRGR